MPVTQLASPRAKTGMCVPSLQGPFSNQWSLEYGKVWEENVKIVKIAIIVSLLFKIAFCVCFTASILY